MIIKLSRSQLNETQWNCLVDESLCFIPYAYSWYLDEASPDWAAWVKVDAGTGQYRAALPVPYMKKWGVRYVRQSPLCFQLGVLSRDSSNEPIELLRHLLASERFISEYYLDRECPLLEQYKGLQLYRRRNFVLDLKDEAGNLYNTNRKRDLKKFLESSLSLDFDAEPELLLRLFFEHTASKIYGIRAEQYQQMLVIAQRLQQRLNLHSVSVSLEGKPIGAAWFLGARRRAFYLLASYAPECNSLGAATGLIHTFIHRWRSEYDILSFNGSEDEGVGKFYQSFGAQETFYTGFRQLNLPAPLRSAFQIRAKVYKRLMSLKSGANGSGNSFFSL